MSGCTTDLRLAGKPYPRTCSVCGLGPCQKAAATRDDLPAMIAETVFPHIADYPRRSELTRLLRAFATDIMRGAGVVTKP